MEITTVSSSFVQGQDQALPISELPEVKLKGKWLWATRIFWALIALAGGAVFINALPQLYSHASQVCTLSVGECTSNSWLQLVTEEAAWLDRHNVSREFYAWYTTITVIITSLIMFSLSLLVLRFKATSLSGWLTSLVFLMLGMLGPRQIFLILSFSPDAPLPVAIGVLALVFLLWPGIGLWAFTFPDGRFAPKWSWILWLYWILQIFWYMLPGEAQILRWSWYLQALHYLVMLGAPLACQIYRYRRRASLVQQQQIKCLIYTFGLGLVLVIFGIFFLPALVLIKPLENSLAYALFPIGVSVAILRYRLWDIDLIINRTLVFALLTSCVVGLYALIVLGTTNLFGLETTNLAISLLATGLIAVLFQPLRSGLQRLVNRLLFGRRDEPYRVLTGLGQQLETIYQPEAVLPELVNNIASALKLPFVAIKLTGQNHWQEKGVTLASAQASELPAQSQNPLPAPTSLTLSYQGETVGSLLVSPRRGEERLTGRDLQLLKDLARQLGVVVYSLKLLEDLRQANLELTTANTRLRRAREKLVLAREEERRRLRRDLHDDLAPSLAGLALSADALSGLIERDPAVARLKSRELYAAIRRSVGNIRRLAHELRPPALDEFGLVAALQERVQQFSAGQVQVELEAPVDLPTLPAAVEVAAYRVAQEALMNVVKHAAAQQCRIRLQYDNNSTATLGVASLILEISDDGRWLPREDSLQVGVGLRSMREQAEELGGTFTIENGAKGDGGTVVRMILPCEGSQNLK